MHFDTTINIGSVVSILVFLGGVAVLYGRLVTIETKVDAVWHWFTHHVVRSDPD